MKLLSFGSSRLADILIDNNYVSGYHAEILLLDNGDIILMDKNSTNGTFVNGKQIAPETEVFISRNDTVKFANYQLNWSQIPVIDNSEYKSIIGIGTHRLNKIHLSSVYASRFHATMKMTKDGTWYICDHSSNGTKVNGITINKNQNVRLKKKDIIECAGERIDNPVPSAKWPVYAGISAVACVVAAALLLVFIHPWNKSSEYIYKTYAPATAMLEFSYYYTISTDLYGTDRIIYDIDDDGFHLYEYDGTNPMVGRATGFFVSDNGLMITNRHVVMPWLYGDDEIVLRLIQRYLQIKTNLSASDIKCSGVLESISLYPNGCLYDQTNRKSCRKLLSSEGKEVDLAIIQTMDEKLPEGATYIPFNKISSADKSVGTPMIAMGFPFSLLLQDTDNSERFVEKQLQATSADGQITMNIDKYVYGYNAVSGNGGSGSPIFDKSGSLIGVVCSTIEATQGYNFAIKSKYISDIIQKASEK